MSEGLYGEALKALAAIAPSRLEAPDGSARLDNPLCGDRALVEVGTADGRVTALGWEVSGCLLCKAAAALAASQAEGRSIEAASGLEAEATAFLRGSGPLAPDSPLAPFLPVRGHKSRHSCVILPYRALSAALAAVTR